ncbi:Heavy metal transport/detoxification protein [Deinococcus geothermalis DSM 11300]|uniref:Heavy metal transport/detoxification protein n=1 Tax=Deinococcus geothermalis (strain DSM 11300 / CIP 105573 / AG-3a) TaxID=319795 RepID=Q1J291_DEIGD|nr:MULTISPECIES: heavy metal-associated domain-containing protein [Deinococcus]ABF44393.1 Heavy metal transport/detoxification protein [Deinococcus geothermalis DSM 11300]TDE85194.1 heavy-metal-associated domain-containing protein [Deinococcus sp. S9]
MTQTDQIELNITGMTCSHCQAGVTRALKQVPGVTDAQVDLKTGKAVVYGNAEPQQLIEAVAEEGYGAQVAPR